MIARLLVRVPFLMAVPSGAAFNVYSYEDAGYSVRVYPPGRSDLPIGETPEAIRIDDTPAFAADALRIDFHKDSFNRKPGMVFDPPEPILRKAVDSVLRRLRYVTRGFQVEPLRWPHVQWRIRYLTDDGEELPEDPEQVRGRGTIAFRWSLVGLNPEIWSQVHSMPVDFEPPVWDELRLDATAALPRVGTAVVLAATCLEVFISQILDALASAGDVPPDLWKWVNDRGNRLRDPSVEEQYDVLLKHFTGRSLKEDAELWESFRNLKSARNSFVHEGTAEIGGTVVSAADAARLVLKTGEIIRWVRQRLPEELKWAEFEPKSTLTMEKKLDVGPSGTASE